MFGQIRNAGKDTGFSAELNVEVRSMRARILIIGEKNKE